VLIKNDKGGLSRNPAMGLIAQEAAIINRYSREFGLTPSARVSLAHFDRSIEDGREIAARLLS